MTSLLFSALFFLSTSSVAHSAEAEPCRVQEGLKVCSDLFYSNDRTPEHRLDVFLPAEAAGKLRPVLVFHGGCFSFGDKSDVRKAAMRLARAGFAAIAPNYRLGSSSSPSYPDVLSDLDKVLEWVHGPQIAALGVDASWVAAYGESSGATYASYLGTRPRPVGDASADRRAAVDAVVDFYGRIDMLRPQPPENGVDCTVNLVKGKRESTPDAFREASVSPRAGIKPARFFIAHGSLDAQVEPWHSLRLQTLLRQAGNKDEDSTLLELKEQGHGFSEDVLEKVWPQALEFLKASP